MSKDETSAQAQLVVLKASLGASLGATPVLISHVCLQINGMTTTINNPFLATGASINLHLKSMVHSLSIVRATPANWMVDPSSSVVLTIAIQGYGLLHNVSARLSSNEFCRPSYPSSFANLPNFTKSLSFLTDVTKDATRAFITFLLETSEVDVVVNRGSGIIGATKDLTQIQWLSNLNEGSGGGSEGGYCGGSGGGCRCVFSLR